MQWPNEENTHRERRLDEIAAILESLGLTEVENNELVEYVEKAALRIDRREYMELVRDLNLCIQEHLHKGSLLIAVRAVNQLVQAEFIREEATKMERMGKFLETALDRLPYVDAALLDSVLNQLVQCYGQVAKSGTAVAAEITKSQIQRMADLLKETDSLWSTLALRMLSELAKMTPALFYRYIENILSDLRRFIFHEQTSIRNDALETLKSCLSMVAQRAAGKRQGRFQEIAKELIDVISEGSVQRQHHALVALRVVVQQSSGNLLTLFPTLSQTIMSLLHHSESTIVEEAIHLLPELAVICPQNFAHSLMESCMESLFLLLRKRIHDACILETIPQLLATCSDIHQSFSVESWSEHLCDHIKVILLDPQSSLNDQQTAVKSIGKLSLVLGAIWKPFGLKILPLMLSRKIDESLLNAARCMVQIYLESLPSFKTAFLSYLSQIKLIEGNDRIITLEILSSFSLDLEPSILRPVIVHLHSILSSPSDVSLRTAAIKACLSILSQILEPSKGILETPFFPKLYLGEEMSDCFDELCDLLITTTVTDTSVSLRYDLVSELLFRDDLHERLSQDAIIHRLSYSLYDSSLLVRQLGIQLLARLSFHNAAAVFPLLRDVLFKLMENFHFNGDIATTSFIVQESALLLRTLLMELPIVTEMHLPKITDALLNRMEGYTNQSVVLRSVRDPTSEAICSLLLCLIEIVKVVPPHSIKANISRMASILNELIKDNKDRKKQHIAMKTIQNICEGMGETFMQHLKVLDLVSVLSDLRTHVRETQSIDQIIQSLTRYDSTFLTLLGPSDSVSEISDAKSKGDALSFPMDESVIGNEEYYSSVAINALLLVLEDPRNTEYRTIIQCLMDIFRLLQKSGVVYLQRVIPVLTKIVRQADDKLRLLLFENFSVLVRIAGSDVAPYSDVLTKLCHQFWSSSEDLTVHILNLIAELALAVPASFGKYLKDLIPPLSEILSNTTHSAIVEPTLSVLQACDAQMGPYLSVLFPVLILFLKKVPAYEEPSQLNVQREVLRTLRHVLMRMPLKDVQKSLMASKLFLTLTGLLNREEALRIDTMDTLVVTIHVVERSISRIFIKQIQNALKENEEHLLWFGLRRLEDPDFDGPHIFTEEEIRTVSVSVARSSKKTASTTVDVHKLDIVKLAHAWDTTERNTKEDWEEWMRSLSVEFLRQSSSPSLRSCYRLANVNPTVAKWLFKFSLLSIWSKLEEQYRLQLQEALETVLLTPAMPMDVVQPIVSLGEYLNFIEQQEVSVASGLTSLEALAAKCNAYSSVPHYRMKHSS